MRVYLEMPGDAHRELCARLAYAFRLFCAIYGHTPIVGCAQAAAPDVTLRYSAATRKGPPSSERAVWLTRGYRGRDWRQPAPPPIEYARDGINTVLHYAPEQGCSPDWIGEIFEWVSCADEYSVTARDRVDRPLYEASYAGRHAVNTHIPYAAVAMRGLQQEICRLLPRAPLEAETPEGLNGHAVIPTHDVDYFPRGRMHTVRRLARNAAISMVIGRSPLLASRQAGLALRAACGAKIDPLDQIVRVALEEERLGFGSSFFFLVRHGHRLDARYSLDDCGVVETMRWLAGQGMEIGLHGSFNSLEDEDGLKREARAMRERGFRPRGNRQHWLHYTLDRLIPAVERAGIGYDSSIGWSTRTGFRAGACFAYPPYDFAKEGPASFLELPLIAMDQALHVPGNSSEALFEQVAQMMAASRQLSWGGIALLWHPAAFGGGWLPAEVGEMYWRLATDRERWNERWMPGAKFLKLVRERYVDAGLFVSAPEAETSSVQCSLQETAVTDWPRESSTWTTNEAASV